MTTKAITGSGNIIKTLYELFLRFPCHILSRPFKGFDEMKNEKKGSYVYAFVTLAAASLLGVMEFVYTGFLKNINNPYQVNSLYLSLVTLFSVALFVTANWSVTTLLDGKGRYGEIFMTTMYALYPMLWMRVISLLLSNVLTLDEMVMCTTLNLIGAALFGLYLFVGLVVVHEYTFGKALSSVLLTLAAMMIITFVLMLLFSLVSDVIDFVSVFSKEFALKYL